MELRKTGGTLTNDSIRGVTDLACGGTLTVVASGDALSAGDTFKLFDARAYSGSFSKLSLPTLEPNAPVPDQRRGPRPELI